MQVAKPKKIAFALCDESDQPGHPHSLTRAFAGPM